MCSLVMSLSPQIKENAAAVIDSFWCSLCSGLIMHFLRCNAFFHIRPRARSIKVSKKLLLVLLNINMYCI